MSYQLDVRDREELALHSALHSPPLHVSPADRLALRLGLWLLLRSSRHVQNHHAAYAEHSERLRHQRSREARELDYERSRRQQGPSL